MNNPGLLLLSKTQMRDRKYVEFHRFSREIKVNGYLQAEVKHVCIVFTDSPGRL